MIIRSKAPLRLGLAGGGSDVSPFSDLYGGLILNATINLFVYCTIEVTYDDKICIQAPDINETLEYHSSLSLPIDGQLDIHKGVYNRIVKDFKITTPLSFTITTYSDAPPGSGLGSSSTLVVAILKAFVEWLNLPLGEYEIGHLAYEIERNDLGLTGGKQDQYAAAFGGFNYMEFYKDDRVIVNPLRIKRWIVDELESSLILYYTGASRSSASIIDEQKSNTTSGNVTAIEAMHQIKLSSSEMKEALLKGDINKFSSILSGAWNNKKKMASAISNDSIENVFDVAIKAGARTGKVSGAGGGGFIMFVVDPTKKVAVVSALNKLDGKIVNFQFSEGGCHGWKIYDQHPKQ
jgi:D-glycero-alpha-D-manno-heptose-7-phosphate kinase